MRTCYLSSKKLYNIYVHICYIRYNSYQNKVNSVIISFSIALLLVAEMLMKYFYTGENPAYDDKFASEYYHVKECLCDPDYNVTTLEGIRKHILSTHDARIAEIDSNGTATTIVEVAHNSDYEIGMNSDVELYEVQPEENAIVMLKRKRSKKSRKSMPKKQNTEIALRKRSKATRYHLPKEPPFVCTSQACNKMFENYERLRSHYRHNHIEKKFKCELCPLRFLYPKDLVCHIRTHTGEKPFICDTCGKGFAQKGTLLNHVKIHMKVKTRESVVPCQECTRAYVYKESEKNPGSQLEIECKESLCCPNANCRKKFSSISTLRKHINNYVCNYNESACVECKIKFETHHLLRKHIAQVHCTHRKIGGIPTTAVVIHDGTMEALADKFSEQGQVAAIECVREENSNNAAGEEYEQDKILGLCSEVVMEEE